MISPDSTIALPAEIPSIAFEVTDLPEHCKYLGETSVQITFVEKEVEGQVEN